MALEVFELVGGLTTLEAGGTHFWSYAFEGQVDAGLCYAGPTMSADNWLGALIVLDQGAESHIRNFPFLQLGVRSWSYTVTIRNAGDAPVAYRLRIARFRS